MHSAERMSPSGGLPVTVTVGASPYTYTADRDGVLIVSGGTVSQVDCGRGASVLNTGVLMGAFALFSGMACKITYAVAPTVTFVPR